MSEYLLILLWFGLAAIIHSMINTQQCMLIHGEVKIRESRFWAIFVFAPVFYYVATRSIWVGDTQAYINMFQDLPMTLGELAEYASNATKDKGFTILSGIIKIVFGNNKEIYFFILAIIQGMALIYVYRRYSISYMISMFLFIASTDYVSWMYNGARQFTAVAIIFAATPWMLKKRWVPLILTILLASTIHGSALLMIPVVFIVQGKAWNKKTMLFTLVCIFALVFADRFTNILDNMLADTQYTNVVSDWKDLNDDGTNYIRVLVYAVPALLSLLGKKWIDQERDPCINLCTNMSIISAAIYLLSSGTSGVYIGRLPIYTSLYGYILIPYLLKQMFTEESARLVRMIMMGAYLAFYYYQMHFAWGLM